jgi:hypothetical protein
MAGPTADPVGFFLRPQPSWWEFLVGIRRLPCFPRGEISAWPSPLGWASLRRGKAPSLWLITAAAAVGTGSMLPRISATRRRCGSIGTVGQGWLAQCMLLMTEKLVANARAGLGSNQAARAKGSRTMSSSVETFRFCGSSFCGCDGFP